MELGNAASVSLRVFRSLRKMRSGLDVIGTLCLFKKENLWGLLESDGKWGERGEEEVEKEENEAKREERRGRRKKCKASCQGGRMKSPIRNHLLSPLP